MNDDVLSTPAARRPAWAVLPAAVLLAAAACAGGPRPAPVVLAAPLAALDTLARTDTLRQPVEIRSRNGVLDVTLEVVRHTFEVPYLHGDTLGVERLSLRAYRLAAVDGQPRADAPSFPGPTFRVRPGDRVRIKLVNKLEWTAADSVHGCLPYPGSLPRGTLPPVDTMPNCFHAPNWTNIHYHGFHVTPRDSGDNVLLHVPPGGTFQYDFRIPLNQSRGTHWYHPHKHGSVALQVVNGMSGAFIVEGSGLDARAESLGMREHLVAIQQVDSSLNLIDGRGTPRALVNGQASPTIVMQPNEVQRWRIVNENVQLTTNYQLFFDTPHGDTAPAMFDVARDGVQFAPANYHLHADSSLIMAPGNRLDVFVQAPTRPGTHVLRARIRGNARARNQRPLGAALDTASVILLDTALLIVKVQRDTTVKRYNTELPRDLPPLPGFLANIDTAGVGQTAVVQFREGGSPGGNATPNTFFLGSATTPYMRFDTTRVFYPQAADGTILPMVLGRTQVWRVENYSPNQINHPFHIHINPFQVLRVEYRDTANDQNIPLYDQLNAAAAAGSPIWLDVVPLPLPHPKNVNRDPGYVVIAQRYDRFEGCPDCGSPAGQFVMHCHILGHEERGMMQLLQIFEPGKGHEHGRAHEHGRGKEHGHGRTHGQHHHAEPGGKGQPQGTPQRPRVPVRKDPKQEPHRH